MVKSMNKAEILETIASFTSDSGFYSERGYMQKDDGKEVAQILWFREHGTELNSADEVVLADALIAYTAQPWCGGGEVTPVGWVKLLKQMLPKTMELLGE